MGISKFTQALQAKQQSMQASESAEQMPAEPVAIMDMSPQTENKIPVAVSAEKQTSLPAKGKRSSADFHQVNVYLKKETSSAVKIALLQSKDERDFSELVQDLLTAWLQGSQKGS